MPEQPPLKRRPPDREAVLPLPTSLPYAELHCRSNFSFLEGASHPDELVMRAKELGHAAIAVTDRNSLAGVVRAHVAAKEHGLKLLVGAEIVPTDAPPIVLWAMHRAGYARLCRLLTKGRRSAPKGECHITFKDVLEHADGLLAGLVLQQVDTSDDKLPQKIQQAFGDRLYLIAELHRGPDDARLLQRWMQYSQRVGVPLVAANDVHCHVRERQRMQDVLTAIRCGCSVAELGERRFPNAERHLKSGDEMRRLFQLCPAAVSRSIEIADHCHFSLDELRYDYPEELCPPGLPPIQHLTNLTWRGATTRYPKGVPAKVRKLVEHELKLIGELNYAAYFLTVWDLVRFAREREILCQGRGSAANSAVCFCLGVTSVDPDRIDVLFERFISKERNEAPDIDVDFEHQRREEVIQYLYEKYGRDRAALTAVVTRYRPRSAIRDVGKALGLSLDRVDALAQQVDHLHDAERLAERIWEAGLPPESQLGKQLVELTTELLDFPRHLSQHVGGMVLTNGPLCESVPIENAAMAGRTVVEWDKDDLDALNILKVDVLALGMLSAIRRCFDLIAKHDRRPLSLATVPAHDDRVFDMICRADTIGVFQIESRAQMSMLPRLKPRNFYDLVIEVSLVRPGPIQGDMVHPYLRRRCGEEPVDYPDERVKAVLEKTLGVPIFQEQAMRLVVVAAGFTPGEADQLRRAMGAWRKRGIIDQFHQKLINGMTANGYSAEYADRVFKQLRGFGEYGFPESHACSFALLVWASAWLKHHYPAAFAAALLNSQPMGFYGPAQLVADARKHGVDVLPVDVNHSDWDCTLERPSPGKPLDLRLGFRMLQGFSAKDAISITRARSVRSFDSMEDFFFRTGISNTVATLLSRADAFRSLQLGRRESLWQALPGPDSGPLFEPVGCDSIATNQLEAQIKDAGSLSIQAQPMHGSGWNPNLQADEPMPTLPQLTSMEEVISDYRMTGLSLRAHPMKFLRARLQQLRVTPANQLPSWPNGKRITVAGLVLMRQRPGTAKGITFVTLEDETGTINLIIRPEVWEQHRNAARTAGVMLAIGPLQREEQVIHVLVHELLDLSAEMSQLETKSRDFR